MKKIILFFKLFFAKRSFEQERFLSEVSPTKASPVSPIDEKMAKTIEVHLIKRPTASYPLYLKYLTLNITKKPMQTKDLKKAIHNMIVFLLDWLNQIEKAEKEEGRGK